MRRFDHHAFDAAFRVVMTVRWQEDPRYYPRYRSRYEHVLRRFAEVAPDHPVDVLEVGGGQLALLANCMWGDRATVADIDSGAFAALSALGVETFRYNLATGEPRPHGRFDVVFVSEVIEHLPVPAHLPLGRLREVLSPSGLLICTTPNLYRLRNIAYLLLGRPLFDHFDLPGDHGFGHVLEYSAEHLTWQVEQAGFREWTLELCDFRHVPVRPTDRALAMCGTALRAVPRFRDALLLTATAP